MGAHCGKSSFIFQDGFLNFAGPSRDWGAKRCWDPPSLREWGLFNDLIGLSWIFNGILLGFHCFFMGCLLELLVVVHWMSGMGSTGNSGDLLPTIYCTGFIPNPKRIHRTLFPFSGTSFLIELRCFFCSTLRKAQVGWIYCELPFEVPQSTSGWNSSLWGITVTGPAKHPPQMGFRTKHGQIYIQKCRVPRSPLPGSIYIYTEGGASQSARSTGRNPAEATPGY